MLKEKYVSSMGVEIVLFVLGSLAVCVGCLVPNRWLPPLPNDKFLHFASFAVLSTLALRMAHSLEEASLWLIGLLIAGFLIECLQSFLPDRRFCWRDMAANTVGIACAALACMIGRYLW